MLLIPRNRDWVVVHTITDDGDIDAPADMSGVSLVYCQIRSKDCIVGGAPTLVVEVTTALSGTTNSVLTLSLTAAQTAALAVGDYHMDAIADTGEVLLPPEVVRVVNHPTIPFGATVPPVLPPAVPDFVDDFNKALVD
jgi:hypothetical protein